MEQSLKAYDFQPYETIASIGASGGIWEIYFASQIENLTFYLQDIDENICNQVEIEDGISFYQKLLGKTISGKFIPIIGTENKTCLPKNTFDKVLIVNSLHEFRFASNIVKDIFQVLKKEGILFIEEQLAKYEGEIHEGCLKPLYKEKELIDFIENIAGFRIAKIVDKGNYIKIFSFQKEETNH
jgi:SAM-dependent methyltransferase